MPEKLLYEYAVIRVVPRVEREEFINVGVILYVHSTKYLCMRYTLHERKLLALCEQVDIKEASVYLQAFHNICNGLQGSGAIGALDAASRFRWLTAYRSTIIQTSRVHPGFCLDPEKELERLFVELAG